MAHNKKLIILILIISFLIFLFFYQPELRVAFKRINPIKNQTLKKITEKYEQKADTFWEQKFKNINKTYPPKKIAILVFKDSKILEVYDVSESIKIKIESFNILAASGNLGPKLKEGDRQVPEGIYQIDYFNPNSSYHLSMRINYPNTFDKKIANLEARENLGSDIYIHGENMSIGCIAIGNEAIEKLFILALKCQDSPIEVIISPLDFRIKSLDSTQLPKEQWVKDLYITIKDKLVQFK